MWPKQQHNWLLQLHFNTRPDPAKHTSKINPYTSNSWHQGCYGSSFILDNIEGKVCATGHGCTPTGGKLRAWTFSKIKLPCICSHMRAYRNTDWLHPLCNIAINNTKKEERRPVLSLSLQKRLLKQDVKLFLSYLWESTSCRGTQICGSRNKSSEHFQVSQQTGLCQVPQIGCLNKYVKYFKLWRF